MTPLDVCPLCGGSVRLARNAFDTRAGDRIVTVDMDALRCEDCGEGFLDPGQMDEIARRAADIARREDGLLGPSEIQAIRARYALSQDAFERLINAGPKTVTRWERGSVCQNGTADTLLRVLRDHPEVVARLAAERAVALGEPAAARPKPSRRKAA